jgi:hypothetical protein
MSWVVRSLLAASLVVGGCKESNDGGADDARVKGHDHHTDGGLDVDAAEFEGCPDSTPEFTLGMSASGRDGKITASLRDASSAPPTRYFNDWTLAFSDADGAPLEDVEIILARAYMRVHGHYGTPDPTLHQLADEPSVFELQRLNLFMRGPWEVQLILKSDSLGEDHVVFDVCVEE